MKIQSFSLHPYRCSLINGTVHLGSLVKIVDEEGNVGWGDIAPLPSHSRETLEESVQQLNQKKQEILSKDWLEGTCLGELGKLGLLPSASFGLESALFSILAPIRKFTIPVSAFFMGSPQEILEQAQLRYNEGYTSAKLKVRHLSFIEAADIIHRLKDKFRLRIDVNRAWKTLDSLQFFSQFALDAFDYVEEPFQNPNDLAKFTHPLAVDESFPHDLTLMQMESFPTLKALVYKPTLQGGTLGCLDLRQWAAKRGVSLVLSSSFESYVGHIQIANLAHRLQLSEPIGIGTYHYLKGLNCSTAL